MKRIKKSFSLILAAVSVLTLLTLTACNNSEESSNSSEQANAPVISSVDDVEISASAAPESTDTTVSDDPIVVPDDPNNPADPDDPIVDNSGLALPDNRAGRMVKAALASGEWGALMLVEEDAIAIVTGVDPADLDEFACVMPMISAVANEVYCLKPKDGKTDAVRTTLSNLIAAKLEDHMMYPMVAAAWENAVLEEDDGYVYLVVHPDNAQAAADIMGATK